MFSFDFQFPSFGACSRYGGSFSDNEGLPDTDVARVQHCSFPRVSQNDGHSAGGWFCRRILLNKVNYSAYTVSLCKSNR
jgi:hypothetical protein